MKKLHQSKSGHVLNRIKNELGLSQADIPDFMGINLDTFKNIVYGRAKSWNEHAEKISFLTFVAKKSLLANDPKKPLLAVDGSRWNAKKVKAFMAGRYLSGVQSEISRGRHTLQWFRIITIKLARCMLAAYKDKKADEAFIQLIKAIDEVGRSFPSYTAKVKWKQGDAFMTIGGTVVKPDKCPSFDWDAGLQGDVARIPSRSRKGIIKIFGRFVKDILAEERKQALKLQFDLQNAKRRANSFAA